MKTKYRNIVSISSGHFHLDGLRYYSIYDISRILRKIGDPLHLQICRCAIPPTFCKYRKYRNIVRFTSEKTLTILLTIYDIAVQNGKICPQCGKMFFSNYDTCYDCHLKDKLCEAAEGEDQEDGDWGDQEEQLPERDEDETVGGS